MAPEHALACAGCWDLAQGLGAGFYWSYLLLTSLPFAVIAAIGAWVRYIQRRPIRPSASPISNPAATE
jgi:hypothetical protein